MEVAVKYATIRSFYRWLLLALAWVSTWLLPVLGQTKTDKQPYKALNKIRVTAPHPERPNIIFILADDLGYTDLSCYGNPMNQTPHIDSLARRGIRFTQAYAASPVCSPSRAAILTGKHPARLRLTNFQGGIRTDSLSPIDPAPWQQYLSASETTLAERLRVLGYRTGMVGKWHLGSPDSLAPWSQGFDYSRMISRNGLDYYRYSIAEDSYQTQFTDDGTNYATDKLTDYAVDFIQQQKSSTGGGSQQPFFLYLPYSAPHVYVVPRGDKVSKYLAKYEQLKGNYNPYYAAMLESLDEGVGRVIAQLRQQGLLDNTLIVFTSDNGGVGLAELGPTPTTVEGLRKWKGHVYEGGIRVPMIVAGPGIAPAAQACTQPLINTDYTLTLLDWLGQPLPTLSDGRSFAPLLKNPQATLAERPLFWHYPHFSNQMGRPAGAVRLGDYKLVELYESGQLELYNLRDDPAESRNLARDELGRTARMHQLLREWRRLVNAAMPIPKKR